MNNTSLMAFEQIKPKIKNQREAIADCFLKLGPQGSYLRKVCSALGFANATARISDVLGKTLLSDGSRKFEPLVVYAGDVILTDANAPAQRLIHISYATPQQIQLHEEYVIQGWKYEIEDCKQEIAKKEKALALVSQTQ